MKSGGDSVLSGLLHIITISSANGGNINDDLLVNLDCWEAGLKVGLSNFSASNGAILNIVDTPQTRQAASTSLTT